MNRRMFLRGLGAAGAGLAFGGGSPFTRAQTPAPHLGKISYQLGWIKNFQFVGEYIADYQKYYARFGIEVDLLSGGPTIIVEPAIVSGKALIGQSMPDFTAHAVTKGAQLKIIGADYQRNVSAIMSLARSPLKTPQEMKGRKIGIQTNNIVMWHAFLKLNNMDASEINVVPVQFDLTPLATGEVDGFLGQVTDDAVQLKSKGIDVHSMLFSDFGYDMLAATYVVTSDSLKDPARRAQIVAFMKGDIMGWQDAVRDPALGARLAVDVYGKGNGLQLKGQLASCIATNDFIVSPVTQKHGLFWMTPDAVEKTIKSLAAANVKATPDMFTNEILEEIYQGRNAI